MKVQILTGIAVLTLISTVSAISTAELELKKVYIGIGLTRKEASVLIYTIKKSLKNLPFEQIQQSGIPLNGLALIFESGMPLELSEQGEWRISDAVQQCITINTKIIKLPYTQKTTRKLLLAVRAYVFRWLKERLSMYDETSFALAYALHESNPDRAKEIWGAKDHTIQESESDFTYDIPFKKDIEQEMGLRDVALKGLSNAFECLVLEDGAVDNLF